MSNETLAKELDEVDAKPADAAIAEAENADQLTVEFNGETYRVIRNAMGSVQYRRLLQRSQDILAAEFLLGAKDFDRLLEANKEPDGFTPSSVVWNFLNAAGEVLGSGNQ